MLGENIKALRKEKGYSQETLAQQLNVVRQTISKWEKGLSVPDAEQLEHIADLFEVPVTELLQAEARPEEAAPTDMAEIVRQLAVLNEQLAYQARSRRRVIKIVLACVFFLLILPVVIAVVGAVSFTVEPVSQVVTHREAVYVLDGKEYEFCVEYDENGSILELVSSPFISDLLETQQSEDAEEMIDFVDNWFINQGGIIK